jgi:hypothetical protein
MAKHADITAALGTQVYFCDPFASLQTAVALQLSSVSAPIGSPDTQVTRVSLPTVGDNPQIYPPLRRPGELSQRLPNSAVDNPD